MPNLIKYLLCSVVLTVAGGLSSAQAVSQGEAEDSLSRANNEYFTSLMSGKAHTAEQKQKLKTDTVDKASVQISQVMESKWHQALEQQFAVPPRSPELDIDDRTWSQMMAQMGGSSSTSSPKTAVARNSSGMADLSTPPGDGRGPASVDAPEIGPETVLDGSSIPRLMDFGHAKAGAVAK